MSRRTDFSALRSRHLDEQMRKNDFPELPWVFLIGLIAFLVIATVEAPS